MNTETQKHRENTDEPASQSSKQSQLSQIHKSKDEPHLQIIKSPNHQIDPLFENLQYHPNQETHQELQEHEFFTLAN